MKLKDIALLLFVFVATTCVCAQETDTNVVDSASVNTTSIHWMSMEEALEANKTEPKLIFVDLYTDWCGWCKRMDATTFKDVEIIKAMNDNFYAVKFNAEQKEDFTIEDRTYSFIDNGRRGYHELAAKLMGGQMSYPTYVFLNSNLEIITKVAGYQPQQDMHPILVYINEFLDNPSRTYEVFLQEYQSPYSEN